MIDAAGQYLSQAIDLLRPRHPQAIAIGGLSGSGKSTLAAALAPVVGALPGAAVIRSDVIRKRLCGAGRLNRLGPSGYTADVSRRVYQELAMGVTEVLESGHSVIADAVFERAVDRAAIEDAATRAGTPFHGVWLDAPDRLRPRSVSVGGPTMSLTPMPASSLSSGRSSLPISPGRGSTRRALPTDVVDRVAAALGLPRPT